MKLLTWFTVCLTGPSPVPGLGPQWWLGRADYPLACVRPETVPDGCSVDFDGDDDVDLADFAWLQIHHRRAP